MSISLLVMRVTANLVAYHAHLHTRFPIENAGNSHTSFPIENTENFLQILALVSFYNGISKETGQWLQLFFFVGTPCANSLRDHSKSTHLYVSIRPPLPSYVSRTFFTPRIPPPPLTHTHVNTHTHLENLSSPDFL